MKKNVLALSIATMIGGLGFSSVASAALTVNESGTGHILVVPYFTAQAGNATGIHLTNTDMVNGKAVKIRIRGASNSDDLLDFQVFLSPGDVWTASISADADGLAQLTTNDTSCTVPEEVRTEKTTKFGKSRLKAGADNAETREGYIEILNMADVPPTGAGVTVTSGALAPVTGASPLYTAIKHDKKVAPCTSTVLTALEGIDPSKNIQATSALAITAATTANYTQYAASHGMTPPSGGLAANWYVVNVPNSTTFSGEATAVTAQAHTFSAAGAVTAYGTRIVYSPQLNATKTGTNNLLTADPLMVSGIMPAVPFDLPDLSTPLEAAAAPVDIATAHTPATQAQANTQAARLTNILSAKTVLNQYLVDPDLGGATDWVLSMPTRRYTVAANYLADKTTTWGLVDTATGGFVAAPAAAWDGTDAAKAPNTAAVALGSKAAYRVFNLQASSIDETTLASAAGAADATAGALAYSTDFGLSAASSTVNTKGQICAASVKQTFLDNEESQKAGSGAVVSPSPVVAALQACGEVSVITMGVNTSAASILGSSVAQSNVAPGYLGGWGSVEFTKGVPALGFAAVKAVNAAASAGMSGNYGLTWAHIKSK